MISNADIASLLRRYAATLRIQGADRFKIKAYERARRHVEFLESQVTEFLKPGGKLDDLPGIGKAISGVIREIVDTGSFSGLESALCDAFARAR